MAKTTVISWKITDSKYGYLWTEETDGPCITDRIIDPARLEQIVGEISNWDETTYASNFTTLSNLIHSNFGTYIKGSYSDYYNGSGIDRYIMLTGKDGANSNGQGNSEIGKETLDKIKTFITSQVTTAKESMKAEINDLKAETNQKIEVLNTSVNEKIDSTKTELVSSTTSIIDGKMEEVSNNVRDNVLTKLENDVPVSSLQELVAGNKMRELETFVNEKTQASANMVENIRNDVDSQNNRLTSLTSNMEEELRATNSRLDTITDEVLLINDKVERVAANKSIKIETANEVISESENNFSKGISYEDDNDETVLETETIDNGDGTFDIVSSIGSETYNIRILSYGNKLKVGDDTIGLVLAPNGIKYTDKSGSSISIINGNIKLSNADGSGKLEIKKDGVYINGKKQ